MKLPLTLVEHKAEVLMLPGYAFVEIVDADGERVGFVKRECADEVLRLLPQPIGPEVVVDMYAMRDFVNKFGADAVREMLQEQQDANS